jgi:tyrosine-protein kinase Etk/Wzc
MDKNPQNQKTSQEESSFSLKDLKGLCLLCLSHWPWFVLSLVVCLCVATYYVLTTPPVYKRSALILVKEDSKGQTMSSDIASTFSNMGFNGQQSNVNNELNIIQSPAVLLEAGKRIAYDVRYTVDGKFHKEELYGNDLPVKVVFHNLKPEQQASLTLRLKDSNTFEASEFVMSGKGDLSDKIVTGKLNQKIKTPVGYITVMPEAKLFSYLINDVPVFVNRTNLYDMTQRIEGGLNASIVDKNATMVELSYTDVLPKRAEDLITMIITVYKESWMEDKNILTAATNKFIAERLSVIERELDTVDEDISSYKSSLLLPDVEAASSLYMEQSREDGNQMLQLKTQRAICQYLKDYLGKGKKNSLMPANTGMDDTAIEGQIDEYNSTLLQRNSLVSNSSEKNPLVRDLDQRLASQREAILSGVSNMLENLNTQINNLQSSEGVTRSQIASNPNQARHLQSVGRQQKVKEALYLYLLQKREENDLSQAFTAYNVRLVSAPSGALQPIAPVRRNIFLLAFALGLLIPAGVIFVRETTNSKVRGRQDLENLSIPFLGEIPYYYSKPKHYWWQPPKKDEKCAVVVEPGKRDMMNESFRVLRTNLEFVTDTESGKANVILLTSFNAGSGKSFLSANLAETFALRHKRVLLIDCDLRHPTSSLCVENRDRGLSDYLSGKVEDLQQIIATDGSMDVLPVGTMPPNPTELLYSDRLAPMFEALRMQYDYIFVDCPPVEIVADTQILERYVDRVIFVVRCGLFERSMVKELQRLYNEKKYKNLSLILNGVKSRSYSNYGYYRYGYGKGYHYYRSSEGGKRS